MDIAQSELALEENLHLETKPVAPKPETQPDQIEVTATESFMPEPSHMKQTTSISHLMDLDDSCGIFDSAIL